MFPPLRFLCALLSAALFLPQAAAGQSSSDLPDLVRRSEKAVVLLRSYDAAGRALGQGSGFLVADGRVVTNAHVLEGAGRVEVYDYQNRILGTTDYAHSLSTRVDLAVLPAMGTAPGVLPLAGEEPPVGEMVVVFGAPQGLANTVSEGIVSGYRESGGIRLMQITAPISQGSSGGPVVNQRGQVVGVSVAMLTEGQNLNFAVPVRDVQALVGSPPGRLAFPSKSGGQGRASSSSGPPSNSAQTPREFLADLPSASLQEAVHGELSTGSFEIDSGQYIESYSVTGRRGDVFTAVVYSENFDATLEAYGVDEFGELEFLGRDDDSAGGTDPLLLVRLRRDGPVGIAVSSYEAGETGAYRLSVLPGDFSADVRSRVSGTPSTDSRWLPSSYTDEFQMYIDRETVRRLPTGYVEAWLRTDYGEIQQESWATYDSDKSLYEFDCPGHRLRLSQIIYYLHGELQDSESLASRSWSSWVPGSVGEGNGRLVCELAGMS